MKIIVPGFHVANELMKSKLVLIDRAQNTRHFKGTNAGVNKKPKKFKTVWHGFRIILKLSGRVNQARLKLSAGFSNTVCWTSKTCFCVANCLI